MARFEDLPLDLLPHILVHLLIPDHLASVCLVSRTFYSFSVPILYRQIAIFPWQKSSKFRVLKLFRTLAVCPNLACHVHELEIRDFPKRHSVSFPGEQYINIFIKGLENCVHLKTCTWTRDGSLTSEILSCLARCPELNDITLNGGYSPHYEPMDLVQLLRPRKVSLIMPSTSVLRILPHWFRAIGQSLTSLSLICKADISITDNLLENISQYLLQLEHLNLAGLLAVTNKGVWSIIRYNVRNIKELSLESLYYLFDILTLGGACMKAGGLSSLRSFTLSSSYHNSLTNACMTGTELLLKESPLEAFQSYLPDYVSDEFHADTFCFRIAHQHRDHLVRFSLHRQCISLGAVEHMCISCSRLEELCVTVKFTETAHLIPILAQATHLHTVHLSLTDRPLMWNTLEYALDIARQCSPTISLVGIETEVWKVERRVSTVEGIIQLERFLTKVEHPDIPERILVVYT